MLYFLEMLTLSRRSHAINVAFGGPAREIQYGEHGDVASGGRWGFGG